MIAIGGAIGTGLFLGSASRLASTGPAHQPALVVLEDCDLIAEDRSFGPMAKPLLFEVLDALDGIDADADVAFLLTTNRVEHLERALSQRPGRVDLAAEIPLPDERGRRALIRLYAGALFSDDAVEDVARGSEGTTASFAKELVRRAVLLAAASAADPEDEHLAAALDALQSDTEALTRSLLGSGPGPGFRPGHGARTVPRLRTRRVLMTDRAADFLALHVPGTPLLLPNPWDAGSARLLAGMGFHALATTSAGFAGTHGRTDGNVTRDEALGHAAAVVGAVDVPVSADLENGLADDPDGVAETVRMAVDVGLAGCSVEDWDPIAHELYAPQVAAERVGRGRTGGPRR